MKKKRIEAIASTLAVVTMFSACSTATKTTESEETEITAASSVVETVETTEATESTTEPTEVEDVVAYPTINPAYIGMTAEDICAQMSIEEKAAQMIVAEIECMRSSAVENHCYSAAFGKPFNTSYDVYDDAEWMEVFRNYQAAALSSETGLPILFGNDSVHGVDLASGTVVYPHNINLGATGDADLVYEIGVLTGCDMLHTGLIWNFAPVVATAVDPRWGRTYECYSSDLGIVTEMSLAYTSGMLSEGVIVCPKHFFADGNVLYGTGENSDAERLIDRGDAQLTDAEIAELLAVYQSLIDCGAQTIMLSHSSLNGVKMHENEYYISYLKNEMGFDGIVCTDYNSIHNCSGEDYRANIILCVNAGCDMLMEPQDYEEACAIIVDAYNNGEISEERINDAVTRILRVKIEAGLMEDPYLENITPTYEYNSDYAHEVARQAAAESFVVLKNDGPMEITEGMRVFVVGPAADDTGALCGGWTYSWQGATDEDFGMEWIPSCRSIIEALEDVADENGFEIVTDPDEIDTCDLVLLCVGETSYTEWYGDTEDMSITGALGLEGNEEAIAFAAESGLPTLTLIIAGRNVIISDYIDNWDSVIMCYLPGSEGGHAVADVLTGAAEATGTLPMPYYSSVDQIGTDNYWLPIGYSAN